jgi:ATP-binding cassette subfamily C protein CydC
MAATLLAGVALLGLSGWFITATAVAALAGAAATFDIFAPGAGIRLLALVRTGARYGERLVTHDATLRVLARLRERLFRGYATPNAAGALRLRPARLLFRLTAEVDALDSLYLRVLAPIGAAAAVALLLSLGCGWRIRRWPGRSCCCWCRPVGCCPGGWHAPRCGPIAVAPWRLKPSAPALSI